MSAFTVIQPHLRYGGAERQTVLLLNKLAALDYSCKIILHRAEGGLLDTLSPRVEVIDLGLASHAAIPFTARRMHSALRKLSPSYVLVKLWSSILAAGLSQGKLPQHTFNLYEDLDPTDHANFIRFGRTKQAIIARLYRARELVTANSEFVADKMVKQYHLTRRPDVVTPAIDVAEIVAKGSTARVDSAAPDVLRVASVGSLIHRKGLDLTAHALRLVSEQRRVEWHVVGDGPLRSALSDFGSRHFKIVHHPGTPNPHGIVAACDLVVHSARSEAFGVVILEALALGVPVIASNTNGPSEMISTLGRDQRMLRLYEVEKPNELSHAIACFDRASTPKRSEFHDYIQPYALDRIVGRWEAKIREAQGSAFGA